MNKGVKEYFTKSRVIVDFVIPAIGNIAARVGIILAAMLVVEGLVFGIGMLVNREKTLALFNIGIDDDDDDAVVDV